MYKQPILLPCAHSVCLMCATELLVQQGVMFTEPCSEPSSPASTPIVRSPRLGRRAGPKADRLDRLVRAGYGTYPGRRRGAAHPQVSLPCPSCRRDVDLGDRGLSDLFRNLTLERIAERYRHAAELGGASVPCQVCKPPAQDATKGCTDCRINYCKECFKLCHPWGTPKAQHEAIAPTLSFRPKVLMCPEHEMERVNLYCKTCQRLICQLCKLRRVHTAHKVTPVASAYQGLKDKLTKAIVFILSNQNLVQMQIQALDELVQQTEANSSQAREEVADSIRELCSALEERQSSLVQAIDECKQERLGRLTSQISEHQSMLEHSGLVGYVQEVLKETDHACFIQAARQLHIRIAKATESLQSFVPTAEPSFASFQLDVSREMKILRDLQFATAPEAPVIDTQRTYAYDQIYLCWRLPANSSPAWHYDVEYRQAEPSTKGPRGRWQRICEVPGTGTAVGQLDTDRVYALRVRGFNKAGHGEYSEEIYLRSPPAPGTIPTVDTTAVPRRHGGCLAAVCLLTIGMGKVLLPQGSPLPPAREPAGSTALSLPGWVSASTMRGAGGFYDAVSFGACGSAAWTAVGRCALPSASWEGGPFTSRSWWLPGPSRRGLNAGPPKVSANCGTFGAWNPGPSPCQRLDPGTPI
ncbi:tripartite motif-containing protein 46-like [Narcine bancroftii]|uniref:tripartite motif-containing protein 46-like n=1 Tax=Narcine bancroftii TaxID=1343680 RepID=UPI00383153FD